MTTKKDPRLEPSEATQRLHQLSPGQRKHLNSNMKQKQHPPQALNKHGKHLKKFFLNNCSFNLIILFAQFISISLI